MLLEGPFYTQNIFAFDFLRDISASVQYMYVILPRRKKEHKRNAHEGLSIKKKYGFYQGNHSDVRSCGPHGSFTRYGCAVPQ
jgi:hypothetical protein